MRESPVTGDSGSNEKRPEQGETDVPCWKNSNQSDTCSSINQALYQAGMYRQHFLIDGGLGVIDVRQKRAQSEACKIQRGHGDPNRMNNGLTKSIRGR